MRIRRDGAGAGLLVLSGALLWLAACEGGGGGGDAQGGGGGDEDAAPAAADPIPECAADEGECLPGRQCAVDGDDLRGGYCSPGCGACPDGTSCADGSFCLVDCTYDTDCARSYQYCDEGHCVSGRDLPGPPNPDDPVPECAWPGSPCAEGRLCARDEDDLRGGYCTPSCAACPAGTTCVDGSICLVTCGRAEDCPRAYQVCDDGVCASGP